MAQWLRIRLPVQGTQVRAVVREDPTCLWATKPHVPQLLSLCFRACEPQLLSPHATTTEGHAPRARALQQEKRLQWEACTPQRRVTPARCNYRKPTHSNENPTQPKIKNNKNKYIKKKFKRLTVPSTGKDVGQPALSYSAGCSASWYSCFRKPFAVI